MREASFERPDRGSGSRPLSVPTLTSIALGVTAALVLAALGAQSRPWTEGGEPGSISNGWLSVVTALAVLCWLVVLAVVAFALWEGGRWLTIIRRREPESPYVVELPLVSRLEKIVALVLAFVFVAAAVTAGVLVARSLSQRSTGPVTPGLTLPPTQTTPPAGIGAEPSEGPSLNLAVLAGGVTALLIAGLVFAVVSRRRRPPRPQPVSPSEELVAVIDEGLDDLRSDPDPRRAVIRAYARMERALSRHGLPRQRSEAPLEYLVRVLAELRGGGGSARRLTDLFAQAKFSSHPVGPPSKEEAIASLTALRDELEGAQ